MTGGTLETGNITSFSKFPAKLSILHLLVLSVNNFPVTQSNLFL